MAAVPNIDSRSISEAILGEFNSYMDAFTQINQRAPVRFESRDWAGIQSDAVERLGLYPKAVASTVSTIEKLMGVYLDDRSDWAATKKVYSNSIAQRDDRELAETYFNSVTRRVFATVGVDPDIEFVSSDFELPPSSGSESVYGVYPARDGLRQGLEAIVRSVAPDGLHDPGDDLSLVEQRIRQSLDKAGAGGAERLEFAQSVFYRGKAAYLIGRVCHGKGHIPIVLAVRNGVDGPSLDAVLLTENEVSILFSFTRSYFHVDTARPYDLVQFLKVLMPRKRIAEIYISIGHNKHGKTELYRDLLRHLGSTRERFEHAPGTPGMVMIVFTMPGYDDVFKVIRDRFAPPKKTTRRAVMDKYRLVFRHDRAGRLMDVQDFQHLEFDRDRFDPDLLEELLGEAGSIVRLEGDSVIISHVYVERRIVPLDVHVRESDQEGAFGAVLDYGQAIKDLASTNIFPGDLLLKNFGVTRHGRVVFYDYDELSALTDITFRHIPPPRNDDEALSDQPWFAAGHRDVFPEEHHRFLGLSRDMREIFQTVHGDLFEVEPWRRIQGRIGKGEIIEIFPYAEQARLPGAPPFEGW